MEENLVESQLQAMTLLEIFLFGALGSMATEMLKLYELRGKLLEAEHSRLLQHPGYWTITLGFVLVSGLLVIGFFYETRDTAALKVIVVGMGMSSLIRKAIETFKATKSLEFGPSNSNMENMFK